MYETIKRLYGVGSLTVDGLDNAIIKGWITEEEKREILAIEVE